MKRKLKTPVAILLAVVSVLHILFGILMYNVLDYFVLQAIDRHSLYFFPRHITMFVMTTWIILTIVFNTCLYLSVFKDSDFDKINR